MEPGVPFALLGAVVLLSVAAWIGLAGTALVRAGGARGSGAAPALLVVAGALVLATVETVTGTALGRTESELLPAARTAGLLLLGAGLYAGALARRSRRPARPVPVPVAVPGVVVPLAAAPAPAALAAAAGVAAALAALRARRDGPGLLVAVSLLLVAAAAGAAPLADQDHGALAVLLLRGAAAVVLLSALLVLTRSSVLGKVVAAILAGVLVMATAAVGVVGTVVARGADREQAGVVRDAAVSRVLALDQTLQNAEAVAQIVAAACLESPSRCDATLERFTPTGARTFGLLVPPSGAPVSFGGPSGLSTAEAFALAGNPVVDLALAGGPNAVPEEGLATAVRLVGSEPSLALVVVVPGPRPVAGAAATSAFVYGIRLDGSYVGLDLERGGYGFSLLVDGDVVASNLSDRERARVEAIAEEAGIAGALPRDGVTVSAEGRRPTVHFRAIEDVEQRPVGTLALSRSADVALTAQRDALRALLLTALVATAVVGGLAVLLGRRTVEPLRRLTAAASRVAAGDLSVTTGMTSRDEVGALSRTFDAMTASVARLTGDLRASAAQLETVLSSMSDGLVSTDAAGRVTSINRAAVVMAGLADPDAALGRPLEEVVDLRVAGGRLALAEGLDVAAEVHPADGDPVPVQVSAAPLREGEGIVLVLRDTTREREVERMKTEFLSNVSHELRTPLTPIRGYADILVSRPGLPADKVTSFAGTILAESLKMNRVVDLLVDVAAIEAGRVTVSPRPVAPASLVDERLEMWRGRAPERAGDFKRRVATRLPPVQVDPQWLGKAIDELIDNAVKYTPAGTPITLTAALAPGGDRVRLAVRDAGPGIAAADRAALFTSFEQVDGSATRRVGGLGLGLSFVRRLAEDAGFPLSVSSELGKGAEFALDLPLAEAPPPPAPRPARRAPARRPRG